MFGSRNGRPFRFERSFGRLHICGETAEQRRDPRRETKNDADRNCPFPMQEACCRQTEEQSHNERSYHRGSRTGELRKLKRRPLFHLMADGNVGGNDGSNSVGDAPPR
jgi:hypothetical protein